MSTQDARAFGDWLRMQLRVKRMSQRQLAIRSGVDHSTISRLVHGERAPTLATAARLARGLRELGAEDDAIGYFGRRSGRSSHAATRVELAIRADWTLGETEVRQVMTYYEALRSRRLAVHR